MRFWCDRCNREPASVSSSSLALGSPQGEYGIKLYRVECHNATQDLAASWRFLRDRSGAFVLHLFNDQPVPELGLRELVERDGFALPEEVRDCQNQLHSHQQTDDRAVALVPLEAKASTDGPLPHLNQRFLRLVSRSLEDRQELREWKADPDEAVSALRSVSERLRAAIMYSMEHPVPTAKITDMTINLAITAMKIFERYGTPDFKPKQNIADVLPSKSWEDKSSERLFAQETRRLTPGTDEYKKLWDEE